MKANNIHKKNDASVPSAMNLSLQYSDGGIILKKLYGKQKKVLLS